MASARIALAMRSCCARDTRVAPASTVVAAAAAKAGGGGVMGNPLFESGRRGIGRASTMGAERVNQRTVAMDPSCTRPGRKTCAQIDERPVGHVKFLL